MPKQHAGLPLFSCQDLAERRELLRAKELPGCIWLLVYKAVRCAPQKPELLNLSKELPGGIRRRNYPPVVARAVRPGCSCACALCLLRCWLC
jgi:hypothetical protein